MGCKGSRVRISAFRPEKSSTCESSPSSNLRLGYQQGYQQLLLDSCSSGRRSLASRTKPSTTALKSTLGSRPRSARPHSNLFRAPLARAAARAVVAPAFLFFITRIGDRPMSPGNPARLLRKHSGNRVGMLADSHARHEPDCQRAIASAPSFTFQGSNASSI